MRYDYCVYLEQNNLKPLQIQKISERGTTLAHKVRVYRPLVHDIEHLLFGLETSQRGEISLIAINRGAYVNEENEFAMQQFKRIPGIIRKVANLPANQDLDDLVKYGSGMLGLLYGEYSKLLGQNTS